MIWTLFLQKLIGAKDPWLRQVAVEVLAIARERPKERRPTPRASSGEDAYEEFAEEVERYDPNYVPNVDLKTCELHIWTNLR
jgi:hypothetical protein